MANITELKKELKNLEKMIDHYNILISALHIKAEGLRSRISENSAENYFNNTGNNSKNQKKQSNRIIVNGMMFNNEEDYKKYLKKLERQKENASIAFANSTPSWER
jgi:hypothetical protein